MLEDRERLKQEVVQAAIVHYGLQEEEGHVYPVVQALELEQTERQDFAYKFAVLVAGHAAIVYRDYQGAYKVEDDPEPWEDEQEEKEAYQLLIMAARYLEIDLARLGSIEVDNLLIIEGTSITRSWLLKLNGESCIIDRHEQEDGPS